MNRQQIVALAALGGLLLLITIVVAVPRLTRSADPAPDIQTAQESLKESTGPIPAGQKRVLLSEVPMACSLCRDAIEAAMARVDGVTGVSVYVEKDEVSVTYDPKLTSTGEIKKALQKAGYKAGGERQL